MSDDQANARYLADRGAALIVEDAAMTYKIEWDRELERRRVLGITHLPDPLPQSDHIHIDVRRGTARVIGPSTNEEKAFLDDCMARKGEYFWLLPKLAL